MNAIEITVPGGPGVLRLCSRDIPSPGAGQVLIKVHAAGINRPDVLQRLGHYPPPVGASDLPGLEVAGEVVGGDTGDAGLRIGDRICALLPGGGYAEYCVAPAAVCLPVPQGLSMEEAASLPETFFTVWSNVFDRADLKGAETFLVHGGSSGIGVAAIQMAHAFGHRVFATAGSDEKCRACERIGATRAINYRTEDFVEVIKAKTGRVGVDVILDMVSGSYVAREINCLADDGRLAIIALLGGTKAQVDFVQVLLRRLTITGSTLRPRSVAFKAVIAERLRERVWPKLCSGEIKPIVHQVFPLEEAAKAHAVMESGQHIGKLVLKVV
jgi:NADPH2:quinone reductase